MIIFCMSEMATPFIKNNTKFIGGIVKIVRTLWTYPSQVFRAIDYYELMGALDPIFISGVHEDIIQFFLSLFQALHSECSVNVPIEYVPSASKSFHEAIGWKRSFFSDNFYHQIAEAFYCRRCMKTGVRYSTENIFLLSVPTNSKVFSLEECLAQYLACERKPKCNSCHIYLNVERKISRFPLIAIMALKRYVLN